MESPNLNQQHHQLQDHHHHHLVGSSSSTPPSFCDANNEHVWKNTPTLFLNNMHASSGEASSPNSSNNSMIQDMGFSLPNNIITIQSSSNQIKEESSTSSDHSDNNSSFPNFNDKLNPPTSPREMLLLKKLSPTYKNHMLHQPFSFQACLQYNHGDNTDYDLPILGETKGTTTTFSQIFPSVNISNLSLSSSMDLSNLQGDLDPFVAAKFLNGAGLDQGAPNSHPLQLFNGSSQYGFDHGMQQSSDYPKVCNMSHNLFSNDNGVLESKRTSFINIVEPKSTNQTFKKQRCESRTPCPPLKVRKEKLGDRIAALQQMVAPFGKTDTASVLMEAIGYIKFLQNQVETLSVPYMNQASKNRSSNNIQSMSNEDCDTSEEDGKHADLRSRGLCLVPLSCMSYIECDPGINANVWPPSSSFSPAF